MKWIAQMGMKVINRKRLLKQPYTKIDHPLHKLIIFIFSGRQIVRIIHAMLNISNALDSIAWLGDCCVMESGIVQGE